MCARTWGFMAAGGAVPDWPSIPVQVPPLPDATPHASQNDTAWMRALLELEPGAELPVHVVKLGKMDKEADLAHYEA